MVPEEFHEFFVASAGVAGALIGLLFVALSVVPESVGEQGRPGLRIRPSAALSAFLNALLVSLFALVPGLGLGSPLVTVAIVGLIAMAGLLAVLARERRVLRWPQLLRTVLVVGGQGVVYLVEFLRALDLQRHPEDPRPLTTVAVLVVVLFLLGIARAWEFVGADSPGLLRALGSAGRAR